MNDSQVNADATRMRPRFSVDLPVEVDEAILRLREAFDSPELHGVSMVAGRHAELLVDRSERRIWSPRLTLRLEDSPPGSELRCRFSPRPDVWTGFMFVYFVLVFLVVFGATLGYVQQVSDETAWGFWAIPVGVTLIACIHLASYVGQRLAAAQMRELRGRLESVLASRFGT